MSHLSSPMRIQNMPNNILNKIVGHIFLNKPFDVRVIHTYVHATHLNNSYIPHRTTLNFVFEDAFLNSKFKKTLQSKLLQIEPKLKRSQNKLHDFNHVLHLIRQSGLKFLSLGNVRRHFGKDIFTGAYIITTQQTLRFFPNEIKEQSTPNNLINVALVSKNFKNLTYDSRHRSQPMKRKASNASKASQNKKTK